MPMGALPLALLLAASGLARIRAQGEVRWGGDLQGGEPYVFRDPRDPEKLVGFEVDLVRALAPSLGVRERFVHNDWSNLVPSLERGDFDLIVNGLEDTQALRRRILLSSPYFSFAEQLVVRRGSTLRTLDALRGHRVGTLASSLAHQILRGRPSCWSLGRRASPWPSRFWRWRWASRSGSCSPWRACTAGPRRGSLRTVT